MKKPQINVLIDLVAALCFLGMIATGYILYGPLPPGTNKSLMLWGLTRHQWGEVHAWISLALLGSLIAHLAAHWTWVVSVVRRQFGLSAAPGEHHFRSAIATIAVLGTSFAAFGLLTRLSVREQAEPACIELTEPEQSSTPLPPGSKASSTWSEVERILRASCLSCHNETRARGDFRVERQVDFFRDGPGRPLVIAGKSGESSLIEIVSGRRKEIAHPDRHRLPAREVEILSSWIDNGAAWGTGEQP